MARHEPRPDAAVVAALAALQFLSGRWGWRSGLVERVTGRLFGEERLLAQILRGAVLPHAERGVHVHV